MHSSHEVSAAPGARSHSKHTYLLYPIHCENAIAVFHKIPPMPLVESNEESKSQFAK